MRLTLDHTDDIVELEFADGTVHARVWRGTTDSGIRVEAFVCAVAVHEEADRAQFERELIEIPTRTVQ